MSRTLANVLVVLALICIEALFVAAEAALISLRESQARALAERGRRGAAVARLIADPNRFLASVQLGVTLTALLSSAVGAVTLSESARALLERHGWGPGLAGVVGVVGVTLVITFVTLVLGELVPKRLALQRAEGTAQVFAPSLDRLATVVRPVIWALSRSTNFVVRLLGGDPSAGREQITEEELRDLVAAHETLGVDERQLIQEVFDAGERQLREVMIPRTEIDFLDAATPLYKAVKAASGKPHSRYPVVRGSHDDVVGFVHVRDLYDPERSARSIRVGELARPVKLVPATKRVLPTLSELRREGHQLAIVVDEYGGTAGMVTLEDLVEELVGEIHDEYDVGNAGPTRSPGGVMEVEGLLNLEDFAESTGMTLPDGPYETVAGWLMSRLGRVPEVGDTVDYEQHRISVLELDGRRVARVRLTTVPAPGGAETPPEEPPRGLNGATAVADLPELEQVAERPAQT